MLLRIYVKIEAKGETKNISYLTEVSFFSVFKKGSSDRNFPKNLIELLIYPSLVNGQSLALKDIKVKVRPRKYVLFALRPTYTQLGKDCNAFFRHIVVRGTANSNLWIKYFKLQGGRKKALNSSPTG